MDTAAIDADGIASFSRLVSGPLLAAAGVAEALVLMQALEVSALFAVSVGPDDKNGLKRARVRC